MTDREGAYERNLRHVAEPAAPSEREKAISASIEDHEALWLSPILREHAHYGDHDHDDESGIAVAYASYIDQKVRGEGLSWVELYAHTEQAIETLVNAILQYRWDNFSDDDFPIRLYNRIEDEFASAFIRSEEEPNIGSPKVIEIDGEKTVAYDEDEAKRSYADMKMAEAEAERLRELEADAEARGVHGRRTPRVNPRFRGGGGE